MITTSFGVLGVTSKKMISVNYIEWHFNANFNVKTYPFFSSTVPRGCWGIPSSEGRDYWKEGDY
jgi:hypothetical protein